MFNSGTWFWILHCIQIPFMRPPTKNNSELSLGVYVCLSTDGYLSPEFVSSRPLSWGRSGYWKWVDRWVDGKERQTSSLTCDRTETTDARLVQTAIEKPSGAKRVLNPPTPPLPPPSRTDIQTDARLILPAAHWTWFSWADKRWQMMRLAPRGLRTRQSAIC